MLMLSYLELGICVLHVYVVGGELGEPEEVADGSFPEEVDEMPEEVDEPGDYDGSDEDDDESEGQDQSEGEDDGPGMENGEDDGTGLEKGEEMGDEEYEFDDGSYIPSTDREEETDYSSLDGFISEDDEYIQSRDKFKKSNLRVITDDLFNGIVPSGRVKKNADGCGDSDYVDSEGDFVSDSTDEEDDRSRIRERHRRRVYDPRCDHKTLKVTTGMRVTDGFQVRDALTNNAIENGWEIRFRRASKTQVEAKCKKPCKWRCYGSFNTTMGAFLMSRVEYEHTCCRNMRNKIVSANWIAKRYLNVFRLKPDTTVKELRSDLVQRFAHDASKWKLYNAKRKIIELLTGSVEEHYAKLRSYVLELMRVDKDGRFQTDVGIGSVFNGIYIGFSGLRKGFMLGCRRVIGLDGAFLKTYLGGAILTAVGSDGNCSQLRGRLFWLRMRSTGNGSWAFLLKIWIWEMVLESP